MHQEDKIKHRLCLIDLEDAEQQHHLHRQLYNHTHNYRKNSDERDISDWMNSRSTEMNKTAQQTNAASLPNYKKMIAFDSTRYQSSLLSKSSSKGKRLELSPIAVKFNAKLLSLNLQRSREAFLQKLHQDPYITHYKSIALRKSIEKQSPKFKQLQFPCTQALPNNHQKTFGLLYLLRRRDSSKIAKKKSNPQDLTVHKIV